MRKFIPKYAFPVYRRLSFLFLLPLVLLSCTRASVRNFPLAEAVVSYDTLDAAAVRNAARLLAQDIAQVTGRQAPQDAARRILVGSLGHSREIDSLVAAGRLDVSEIAGTWERYLIQALDERTLVVAGSDRRGAAYGAFRISEEIGVSPFAWWADVPVRRDPDAAVDGRRRVSESPSVKYRGIFINDEDWGLQPWAAQNYEKELGDIGPRTYERVCELILRLGGNMLAPAMHDCTGAFYSYPESKAVADAYGIVITTSHCEPLLLNNFAPSEWNSAVDGDWNYATNAEVIRRKWDERLSEAACYENIYTTAMRGVHDAGLQGNLPMPERVPLLEQVIRDQRELLRRHTGLAPEEVPQIFVPYKETMDIYEAGLEVPDDVTIVWVDDNYGYMKRVPDAREQQRSGGSGVYYHVSYLGAPHDYLWLNTTPPVLMYEELMKAYRAGADRYWLLNVGDIKPAELAMKTFFDLARNVASMDLRSANRHQSAFLAEIFGSQYEAAFQDILDEYYRLAWSRKPEYMGWEREWDHPRFAEVSDTQFSFENYNDARQRLADYGRISDLTAQLEQSLPEEYRPAFFELLAFPVRGAAQMNRKFLLAQLNRAMSASGHAGEMNWARDEAVAATDSIDALCRQYDTMLDGKWRGLMSVPPGYCARYQERLDLASTGGVPSVPVDLSPKPYRLEGCLVLDLSACPTAIPGIGYDWVSAEITDLSFPLPQIPADSVSVHIWTLPFWPLHPDCGNAYAVSLDGGGETVCENRFREYGFSWKNQVLCNGTEAVVTLALDPSAERHSLRLRAVDEGQIVQRIIVDWGGLLPSYVGPPARTNP